jgi:hypothetical protein
VREGRVEWIDGAIAKHRMQSPGALPSRHCEARWSVDASGRLQAEGFGQAGTADAWLAGDQLTVSMDGRGLTFTRIP